MALTKWNPWRFEDFFDHYAGTVGLHTTRGQEAIATGDWSPRVDIVETEKEFVIKVEIPEVCKEDVNVSVDNRILTVLGERKKEKEEKGKKFHRTERYHGSFLRSFVLPDNVDEISIKASFKDGMLNIYIQKTEKKKPKEINIKID